MCRSISGFLSALVVIAVLPFISGIVAGVGIGYLGLSMPIVLALIASLARDLDLLEKAFIIKKSVHFRAISKAKSTNRQERLILFLGCQSEKCGYQFGVKICNEALTLSSNADKPLTEPPLE